ncbi:unnamed protein product [Adineta steineri]|uniref:Uncharacterized protein n=1 Tax=Adineta steineri TaxID=433720 RepID=A0A819TY90_9BILA|nr:unnamed protein product [Adineta steineri]CAF1466660.1 unnamed protein product [Adineta steineri]CAF3942543.1 unnamed protein product [Adineta steineri]CAF4085791.1 unnamed protein product [Adineta steineri]
MRPVVEGDRLKNVSGDISDKHTFEQLKVNAVRVEDLLSWSAPMDLVERYQEYLATVNTSLSNQFYFNCTRPWFGWYCQYTFNTNASFADVVEATFTSKNIAWEHLNPLDHTNLSCYIYLNCTQGPGFENCLDWREICDGKVDCIGSGIDELHCFELEINECGTDEFRCHNGMCIPNAFYNDDGYNPDCLDGTDENRLYLRSHNCYQYPGFRCEETDAFIKENYFICGDGQRKAIRLPEMMSTSSSFRCSNRRDIAVTRRLYSYEENLHLSNNCWFLMYCITYTEPEVDCGLLCEDGSHKCDVTLESQCVSNTLLIFPQQPLLDGHIRFAYLTNRTISDRGPWTQLPLPDYICFDATRTPFLPADEYIDGAPCVNTQLLGIKYMSDIMRISRTSLSTYATGNRVIYIVGVDLR